MTQSFFEAGYECVFGDLMFGLGIPIAIKGKRAADNLARIALPLIGRLPLSVLYPTGAKQEEVIPKYEKYYTKNAVTAGDWLYIKRHMPDEMRGKVIVTNTTTPEDIESLRKRGVSYLVTTTISLDGRTFGTNAMEAALVALAGKGRALTHEEYTELIKELEWKPTIHNLQ